MQYLIPNIPIKAEGMQSSEFAFGLVYDTIAEIARLHDQIQEEVGFDGIETTIAGEVFLTLEGERVSTATMSSRHADAHLVLGDPS